MPGNATQNWPTASSVMSSSKRNETLLHRIASTHMVSLFLWTGVACVAHAHSHNHSSSRVRVRWHPTHSPLAMLLIVASMLLIARFPSPCHAVGYSYARFVGPVSGPEREILVHDTINGGSRVDYVARPEYQFAYGVEDSETQVLQNRKETRNGDEVKGVYSVVDPDGTLRVVKYTADNQNGFQAEVITNGIATIHGQNADDAIKDNNGGANWHVETGNKDYVDTNENDYEVHHAVENDDDDSDDDRSKASDTDGGAYYDDEDGNDDADQIEEYEEEAHSEEANDADAYSDESSDY